MARLILYDGSDNWVRTSTDDKTVCGPDRPFLSGLDDSISEVQRLVIPDGYKVSIELTRIRPTPVYDAKG